MRGVLPAWIWLLFPPLAVVATLLLFHDVFAVFAVYHLDFCLLLPLVMNLILRRTGWANHLNALGLITPRAGRMLLLGLGLAVLHAAIVLVALRVGASALLPDTQIAATLADWGVTPGRIAALFWFMVLFNGPAEELYWRGFVHSELAPRPDRTRTLVLTAACYASYHGVTLFLLHDDPRVAALFLGAVFAAGLFWGWLREKTGSVWPPLLAHTGAVAAYMYAAYPLLGT